MSQFPSRSSGRRQFLQNLAAGAALGPTALFIQRPAAAETEQVRGGDFPDVAKGEVLRTQGELTAGGHLSEAARTIPVAGHSDVLVCGGGPAGIGAALAAARSGARVQLLEVAGCLGGVWTAGLLT